MATPKSGYYVEGERVPGVTTILSRFKESGGLQYWSWQQGYEQGKAGKPFKYMEAANKAADIGTAAHKMIERHINGLQPEVALEALKAENKLSDEDAEKASNAFLMYLEWEGQSKLKFLSKYQEIQLVCPEYKFGGTPDAIAQMGNETVLLDWKTSNAVYSDYLLQIAAYIHLVRNGLMLDGNEPVGLKISGGAHLLRFSKDQPDFSHYYFGNLDAELDQFLLYRKAFEADKKIKKRAA